MMAGGINKSNIEKSQRNIFVIISSIIAIIVLSNLVSAQQYESGWEKIDTGIDVNLYSAESNDHGLWVFGDSGTIGNSLDNGLTWKFQSLGELSFKKTDSNSEQIVSSTSNGEILVIENIDEDGEYTTKNISRNGSEAINDVAIKDDGSVLTIGAQGSIWHYDGLVWTDRSISDSRNLLGISFMDSSNGLITGDDGLILATSDGGISWDYRDAPEEIQTKKIIDVEFYSQIRAYAITDEGNIIKSAKEGETGVGFIWNLIEIESENGSTSLGTELNAIEVLSTNKLLLSGPSGFLAISKDGGNIVSSQIIPVTNETNFTSFAMLDNFQGIVVGSNGVILQTDNAGENEVVGFQVIDFNDFGQFVDYSKGMIIDGFFATLKIVIFGILMGFSIGVFLSVLKTSPVSMKDMAQTNRFQLVRGLILPFWTILHIPISIINLKFDIKNPLSKTIYLLKEKSANSAANDSININAIRSIGAIAVIFGLHTVHGTFDSIESLNLDGWEHIFVPVGAPREFASIIMGIALIVVGIIFITCNGDFSIKEIIIPNTDRKFIINPWGIRPLNSIATLYTDFFRNTPLIVQFMFIHFGLQLGKIVQGIGLEIIGDSDGTFVIFIRDEILADRAYISAIFALGLNSGAYQCETIRGAISAIPSGQMEAGRSIGLNYFQTMRLIIMPQAIRICIPPLGNEVVNLVLNSSLAMVIGYAELTRQGKLIIAITFQIFWAWGLVMISYFIVTWTLALMLRRIEKKTRIPGLGISGGA